MRIRIWNPGTSGSNLVVAAKIYFLFFNNKEMEHLNHHYTNRNHWINFKPFRKYLSYTFDTDLDLLGIKVLFFKENSWLGMRVGGCRAWRSRTWWSRLWCWQRIRRSRASSRNRASPSGPAQRLHPFRYNPLLFKSVMVAEEKKIQGLLKEQGFTIRTCSEIAPIQVESSSLNMGLWRDLTKVFSILNLRSQD